MSRNGRARIQVPRPYIQLQPAVALTCLAFDKRIQRSSHLLPLLMALQEHKPMLNQVTFFKIAVQLPKRPNISQHSAAKQTLGSSFCSEFYSHQMITRRHPDVVKCLKPCFSNWDSVQWVPALRIRKMRKSRFATSCMTNLHLASSSPSHNLISTSIS